MTCDRGDFAEYSRHPPRAQRPRAQAAATDANGSRARARRAAAADRRACAGGCSSIRATPAPTARSTPAGRSGAGGSSARPTSCAGRSAAAPAPSRRSSTASSTCSSSSDYVADDDERRARRVARAGPDDAAHLRRARPARRRVAAHAGSGTSWMPPSLAALACCLVYEPRRDEAGARRARPAARTVPRRARARPSDLWRELDDLEQEHRLPGSRAARRPGSRSRMHRWAQGARARRACCARPTWRPATSCAGRSRRSTCSTSSRSSPTASSAAPRARRSTPSAAASSPTAASPDRSRPWLG